MATGGETEENKEAHSYLRKLARGEPAAAADSKGIEEKDIQLDKLKKNKKRQNAEVSTKIAEDPESPLVSSDVVRLANKNPEPKSLLLKNKPKNIFASPTTFLGGSGVEREIEDSTEDSKSAVVYEGEMMRKAKENKLKKYWYKLFDKELRVYKRKEDETHKTMVNLISVFLRVDPDEPLDKKNTLYPFSLIFPNKERTFYLLSSDERDKWMEQIKKAIGYASLFDFYEVKDAVGKGKFGTVKLGIHK